MIVLDQIKERFAQLERQGNGISFQPGDRGDYRYADARSFFSWQSSALSLVREVFGSTSPHYERFDAVVKLIGGNLVNERMVETCRGIFEGAKADVDGGYLFRVQAAVSGEVFGDFILAAKTALDEGNHNVSAVLACAALEDALKRYAAAQGMSPEGKSMEEVINMLKAGGLVGGAQKSLLSAMPKIRNHAMHAEWEKLTAQDVGSVIGYVERFLLAHFS